MGFTETQEEANSCENYGRRYRSKIMCEGQGEKNSYELLGECLLKDVGEMRRMRQGNTHGPLVLHYPGLWEVKNDVYFICFEWPQRGCACLCLLLDL